MVFIITFVVIFP